MATVDFDAAAWTRGLFDRHYRRHAYRGQIREEFKTWQRTFRADLREVLGLSVMEQTVGTEFLTERISSEECEDYTREKWRIRTEEDFWVPFYLLLPETGPRPLPVVLTVHGHNLTGKELYVGLYNSEEERLSIAEGERDIALQAVRNGYAAIAPDMRGFNELANPEDQQEGRGTCRTMQLHAQLFGRTLVGERVWDVQHLMDFVATREDLDETRIAITGNSGGGTVSLFTAAVDERISVALPASYFCSFEQSIGSIHHCACNYIPGLLQLGEMWDVAGLIAPRPLRFINGEQDQIFPIAATRQAFERVRILYSAINAGDRCSLYVGEGGHRYYSDGAWSFLAEQL